MRNLVYTIVLLSVLSFCQAADKLKVSLYYESLCPGCTNFIRYQLHPVYSQFEDYLELDMVPFGNAYFNKVGNKWQFQCQHGPKECYGNVIHACALDSSTPRTALDFIACCESQNDRTSDETFQKCASNTGINFEDLKHCKETKGDDLLAAYGKRSKEVKFTWVPFITLNDKYDEDISNRAMEDLRALVCEHFAGNPPKGCPSTPHLNEISVCRA